MQIFHRLPQERPEKNQKSIEGVLYSKVVMIRRQTVEDKHKKHSNVEYKGKKVQVKLKLLKT